MKYLYCCLLFILLTSGFAQPKTIRFSLYYDIDRLEPKDNYRGLDSLYQSLAKEKYVVAISGYADYLSSDLYNFNLSQRRAEAVRRYLQKKGSGATLVYDFCEGLGEKNSHPSDSKEGEATERRVDVTFQEQFHSKKIGTRENIIQRDSSKAVNNLSSSKTKPEIASSNTTKLEDLKTGESITIEGLNFIPGRHIPVNAALPVLEKLLSTMKEHPNLKIEIQGHICCIYETKDGYDYDTHDMQLSTNRALTVYNYLVKNGIAKERMTYKGYGRTQPKIQIEKTPEDEQINRRVDIKILEN